jgi:DnaD/phage-associated family protein
MEEKKFSGFSQKSSAIPVPDKFFSEILPDIEDINELRVTLFVYWYIKHKKGYPRFIKFDELKKRIGMVNNSGMADITGDELLGKALELAYKRGTLFMTELEIRGIREEVILFNMEPEKSGLEKFSVSANVDLDVEDDISEKKNIFGLYEQNIGMITPIVAEELRKAEEEYPPEWITDAFKEAVEMNKRNWRYISRILETWSIKGKEDGKAGRYTKKAEGTEKYFRGKYGHMVQR